MVSGCKDGRIPQIGEVYLMRFSGENNVMQSGLRPGVVFQNNRGNEHSPNVIALPLTSALKKRGMPTHVFLSAREAGLRVDSLVLCENPACVSKEAMDRYLTKLSDEDMAKVAVANLVATSGISFLDLDTLVETWETAKSLNTQRKSA